MFGPYQSAATAQAADGHAFAVDAAGAEGTYQTAVAAARRAYQQAAAPIEIQFAFDVYQAESAYQRALAAQDPNAWTQYQADLQAAAGTRQAAIQPLLAAQQAALTQAERDRTTALADAQRDRAERLADREQTYTQGYGVANRGYLSGLAGVLWDLDYDLAPLDETYQNAVAAWDAQRERDYAQSQTLRWSTEQDAENDWSQAAGQAQADLWRAEYLSQTTGVSQLDYQLNSPWSDFQLDLASAKRTWWNSNEPAYLDWIDQTGAADTAYQQQVNAAYLSRTGDWTAADVDYTDAVAAAARQRVEDRADEQYDYLTDQASRSYTYVDQYAQSRHDARLAWAAAERWSRLGQDDSGAPYDQERYAQDVQAAQDAFQTATDSTRREYRTHRATGEAHRQIRSAEIDLQYVEDVTGALVDWTADVEKSRRIFSHLEATSAWGRTYAVAAVDDSYWRQEADTFAADLTAMYPPSSSSLIVAPWGPYAASEEAAEAGWVTTTSTSRNAWEDTVADARKTERSDVAEALETRNNRLATAWADREITKAEGRLQTARSGGYDDVLATLAGTRKQPLPRLPDCSPAAPGVTAAGDQDAACLPSFSPLNLDAVLADDYTMPGWTYPRGWDDLTATAPLSWVRPVQLAENQVHPVPPPLPGSFIFSSPSPPPPPTDLSASLASSDFPEYYNHVIDLIFGNWDFDHTRHLRGFRPVGTGVDAVFAAYASPPTEATEHLVDASANGTSGTVSGDLSPGGGYTGSGGSATSGPGGTNGGSATGGTYSGGYAGGSNSNNEASPSGGSAPQAEEENAERREATGAQGTGSNRAPPPRPQTGQRDGLTRSALDDERSALNGFTREMWEALRSRGLSMQEMLDRGASYDDLVKLGRFLTSAEGRLADQRVTVLQLYAIIAKREGNWAEFNQTRGAVFESLGRIAGADLGSLRLAWSEQLAEEHSQRCRISQFGACQALAGGTEAVAGVFSGGFVLILHGLDNVQAGVRTAHEAEFQASLTGTYLIGPVFEAMGYGHQQAVAIGEAGNQVLLYILPTAAGLARSSIASLASRGLSLPASTGQAIISVEGRAALNPILFEAPAALPVEDLLFLENGVIRLAPEACAAGPTRALVAGTQPSLYSAEFFEHIASTGGRKIVVVRGHGARPANARFIDVGNSTVSFWSKDGGTIRDALGLEIEAGRAGLPLELIGPGGRVRNYSLFSGNQPGLAPLTYDSLPAGAIVIEVAPGERLLLSDILKAFPEGADIRWAACRACMPVGNAPLHWNWWLVILGVKKGP